MEQNSLYSEKTTILNRLKKTQIATGALFFSQLGLCIILSVLTIINISPPWGILPFVALLVLGLGISLAEVVVLHCYKKVYETNLHFNLSKNLFLVSFIMSCLLVPILLVVLFLYDIFPIRQILSLLFTIGFNLSFIGLMISSIISLIAILWLYAGLQETELQKNNHLLVTIAIFDAFRVIVWFILYFTYYNIEQNAIIVKDDSFLIPIYVVLSFYLIKYLLSGIFFIQKAREVSSNLIGSALSSPVNSKPSSSSQIEVNSEESTKQVFCPYCGSKIPNGSTFCPQCGKNLEK